MMTSVWKGILKACLASVGALATGLFPIPVSHAALGDQVVNVATVSQDTPYGRLTLATNRAVFTVEARATPSQIDFFRFAPGMPDAILVQLNGSDYSPDGVQMPTFERIEFAGLPFSTGSSVALAPADRFLPGEVIIVRVTDPGQNGDPNRIETVIAVIRADTGDEIVLRLYESGPDTGEFLAWFQTSAATSAQFDAMLTAPPRAELTAVYVDVFDATEVSFDVALVDPYGRVFDSLTGELLDGVPVTIVDEATGGPARVLGLDGVSAYPASVVTGQSVTDAGGTVYTLATGEFLFPLMAPGRYRLQVGAPEDYLFPSGRLASDMEQLENAPFEIVAGSYGLGFEVSGSGPVELDVPLDPNGELVLRKEAFQPTASLGDFVGYSIDLQNGGRVPAPVILRDILPEGMRYVAGSARLGKIAAPAPSIGSDGRTLTFTGGAVLPGKTLRLTYLAAVGPGTKVGDAVNRVIALNPSGNAISNLAEAAITIEEDLLRSRLTIIGRIAEAACTPDEDWSRALTDGQGIAGVRLYMESGRYTVTDENGLYHFEGIDPGTHVVQVDRATLPKGYDPVICEENTRYGGSALSKFVDAQGGTIWRANFYLKRNGETLAETASASILSDDETAFGQAWLDTLSDPQPRWAYPEASGTPDGRSVNLGFVHGPGQRVSLSLNGRAVSALNFSGMQLSASRQVAISRWSGVDIQRGANEFQASLSDADGKLIEQYSKTVWFVDEVHTARLIADQSVLVADGRTRPVIAVRVEDANGRPVHGGRLVQISVSEPYRLARVADQERELPVGSPFSTVTGARVGADGIALVELEPTLQAGRVRIRVDLHDGGTEEVAAWLKAEQREWVLVGLAQAEGVLFDAKGEDAAKLSSDGRLAFFAKGMIRGDWLATIAVDTAKRRGAQDGEIFDQIDPNAYYTLYGDRTWQFNDAESQYPVYVKLERGMVQALFGDFDTNLTDTRLGRYARRLSGLKFDYEGERGSVTAFASETSQRFAKDEIAADGTSGPYRLGAAPLVRSSETIIIETRDRFRPDQVVSALPLARYIDYEIDYATGELFLRQPASATDSRFNPNVIVIDYETAGDGARRITAGGRAAGLLAEGALETGLTVIREQDGRGQKSGPSDLVGVDVTLKLGAHAEIRAEASSSRSDSDTGVVDGDAFLIEAVQRNDTVTASAYFREESAGFGLGQQSSATAATRRIGAQVSLALGITEGEQAFDRSERSLDAQAYREQNLTSGTRRDLADIALVQDGQTFGASVGLRAVAEDFDGSTAPRQSVLLTGGVRKTFVEHGLTVSATHEEPVYGGGANDDEATLFPGRTVLGVDQTLGRQAVLSLRHEITNGSDASGQNTIAGISWTPLTGTQLRASSDLLTGDNAQRIGATVGVDQTWRISPSWSAGVGLAGRREVDSDDTPRDVTPDRAIGPLEDGVRSGLVADGAYMSGYLGLGYQADRMAASGRIETRKSELGRRLVATLGGAREVSQTLSFSGAARYQDEPGNESYDMRIGTAWRPRGEGLALLGRFDVGHDDIEDGLRRTKLVSNLAVNTMLTERSQVSLYHGLKYVEVRLEGATASGVTQLVGGEVRHDLSEKLDIGLHGFWTSGEASKTSQWALGPSLGVTPAPNVWVSVGWNLEGFSDEDFEAAEFTRTGPFIKIRAKFDQDTVRSLIEELGLNAQ